MNTIEIYTDGSCLKNSAGGPGGWAAIIVSGDKEIKLGEGYFSTTNNRMEIMAVLKPLLSLNTPHRIKFYTDSEYTINGATRWLKGWVYNNWKNRMGEPVKNQDLWLQMKEVIKLHQLEFIKVKAHSGIKYNEMADVYAKQMAGNPTLQDREYERLNPKQ